MIGRREFLPLLPAAAFAQSPRTSGTFLYAGAFPGKVLVYDEAQEKVVDQIAMQTGLPGGLSFSYDRKKLMTITRRKTGIEVIDLASRKVTNSFLLDEGNRDIRTRNFAPDPKDELLYTIIETAVKKEDRFEIEKPKFAVIDLSQKKIVRTAEFPREEAARLGRGGGGMRVTPDGKFLYLFRENVLIFDTADFKLVEKIELSRPLYPGMERVGFFAQDDPNEDRGIVTGIFNSTDPVVHRSILGIARFDLNKRTFEFTPIAPSGPMMGLQLSPDRKTGYTVAFQGDHGNRRCEFWVFDMQSKNVTRRVEFDGPVNFGMTVSGDGKSLYLHATYPLMEVYDAATLKWRKTVDFGVDLTGGFLVGPRGGA